MGTMARVEQAVAKRMLGIIAHVPNEPPRFVSIPNELLSIQLANIAGAVRRALCSALGLEEEDEDEFRVLFRERDLDEQRSAAEFVKSLGAGMPCAVKVLFRLLGGKGGFGALLRKQAKKGKKTTNFDACRDLSGRRLRHSKAVERIKEWMEKNKRDDELVKAIIGEGPDLPKAPDPSESLAPEYVNRLKRAAASRPGIVSEGLRRLLEEEEQASADAGATGSSAAASASNGADAVESTKRARTISSEGGAASVDWVSAMGALGALGSLSSSEEGSENEANSDANAKGGDVNSGATANGSRSAGATIDAAAAPASSFDQGVVASAAPASSSSAQSSAVGVAPAADADEAEEEKEEEENEDEQLEANGEGESAVKNIQAENIEASPPAASNEPAAADPAPSRGRRGGRGGAAAAASADVSGPLLGTMEVATFESAAELLKKASPDDLKRSLLALGMKCGGTPKERAERLFLLKSTPLKELPKSVMAPKK